MTNKQEEVITSDNLDMNVHLEKVRRFLLLNDFDQLSTNKFDNNRCTVIIGEIHYEIYDKVRCLTYFTDNHSVYTLFGYLIYNYFVSPIHLKWN